MAQLLAALPELPLFGMDGLAYDELADALPAPVAARLHVATSSLAAAQLPPAGREVAARLAGVLGREPDLHAVYEYEAMTLLCDALADVGPDCAAIAARLRATRERDAVLGRYDLDARGATTLAATGRLRVQDGRFVRTA